MKETINNNIKIALFMGYVCKSHKGINRTITRLEKIGAKPMLPHQFRYHISWDALTPVCKKIESNESVIMVVPPFKTEESITPYLNAKREMKDGAIRFDLERTYNGVLKFIDWYTEHKPTN